MLTLKKILIAASGPITNFLCILIGSFSHVSFLGFRQDYVIYANLLIAIFNLLPIYPLDGGRILKGILHILYGRKEAYKYTNIIANSCIALLTAICSIVILYIRNVAILIILAYLWYLVITENRKYQKKKKAYQYIDISTFSCDNKESLEGEKTWK